MPSSSIHAKVAGKYFVCNPHFGIVQFPFRCPELSLSHSPGDDRRVSQGILIHRSGRRASRKPWSNARTAHRTSAEFSHFVLFRYFVHKAIKLFDFATRAVTSYTSYHLYEPVGPLVVGPFSHRNTDSSRFFFFLALWRANTRRIVGARSWAVSPVVATTDRGEFEKTYARPNTIIY